MERLIGKLLDPYLEPQEVSKASTTIGTYDSLPKSIISRFGYHCPLGVNLSAVTDVLNTRQNIVCNKEIDLNVRQDDQEVKHKILIEYIELERIQEQCAKNMN
jgi:hypothetical protein